MLTSNHGDAASGPRILRSSEPVVSVVIASHQGAGTIGCTLRSLARQTLPLWAFEVIVVQNGDPDHTAKIIDEVRSEHPGLCVRRLQYQMPGAGRARNAGVAMARGAYTAFIDDDDTVSPRYLQGLLACSSPDTVGVAQVADVHDVAGAPDFDNRLARQLSLAGQTVAPSEALSAMTYTGGKMLPTDLARSVGYDPDLRSGEDVVHYLRFFMAHPLTLSFVPLDAHAVYYRTVVPGSLSRQPLSYDFNVTQRLDVIDRLEGLRPTEDWHRIAIRDRTREQTRRINEFLRVRPQVLPQVMHDIRTRGLTSVPLSVITAGISVPVGRGGHAGATAPAEPMKLAG